MHLIKSFLLSLVLVTVISACEETSKKIEEKFLVAGMYDSRTVEAESLHLNSLDLRKLSDSEKQAVYVRMEDLEKMRQLLKGYTNIINISRCHAAPRVPPLPCPTRGDLLSDLPEGSAIDLDLFGVYMDIPERPEVRLAGELGSMQLTTVDGKDVFAFGTLNTYDSLFRTAWYHFDVKNPELAKQPLILKIETVIILKQDAQQVVMEIPMAEETFLVK